MDAVRSDAHLAEVGRVGVGLGGDGCEGGEGGAHEGLDEAVALDAAFAEAAIDDADRDAAARTLLDHVGPNFELNGDEEVGLRGAQEAADGRGEVQGITQDPVLAGVEGGGAGEAGVRGGGDDGFEVRLGFEAADELLDEIDFADTDGVEEDALATGGFGGQRLSVAETAAPVGAPLAGAQEAVTPEGAGDEGGDGVGDIARQRHGGDCTAGARARRVARLTLHGGHRSQHAERAVGA